MKTTDKTSVLYTRGSTPFFASQVDPRLHYCLHVPRDLPDDGLAPLIVMQHGTGRTAQTLRTAMRDFADRQGAVILAPMFPAGLIDPDDLHNFKFIAYRGIRFDHMLLTMIDEVAARYPVATDRFYLHGFSGGGQFTHRFLFLHPDRLAGASIGAPGRITELDDSLPWWLGTKDFEQRFGQPIDLAAVARVPVHMVVGSEDTDTFEINNRGDSNWMDGCERAGLTRVERLQTLQRNFEAHGVKVKLDIVEGVGHRGLEVLPAVQDFFGSLMQS